MSDPGHEYDYDEGWDDGYADGRKDGFKEGWNDCLAKVLVWLDESGIVDRDLLAVDLKEELNNVE